MQDGDDGGKEKVSEPAVNKVKTEVWWMNASSSEEDEDDSEDDADALAGLLNLQAQNQLNKLSAKAKGFEAA